MLGACFDDFDDFLSGEKGMSGVVCEWMFTGWGC
jgi:hypothetical protein